MEIKNSICHSYHFQLCTAITAASTIFSKSPSSVLALKEFTVISQGIWKFISTDLCKSVCQITCLTCKIYASKAALWILKGNKKKYTWLNVKGMLSHVTELLKELISQVAGNFFCLQLHKRRKNFQGYLEFKGVFIIQNAIATLNKDILLSYLSETSPTATGCHLALLSIK